MIIPSGHWQARGQRTDKGVRWPLSRQRLPEVRWEKAESLSFLTVPGFGGPGQSLHNKILVGAKQLNCRCLSFLLSFVHVFFILIPTHSYHTLRRVYSTTSLFNIKTHLQPWRTRQKSLQTTQSLPHLPTTCVQVMAKIGHSRTQGQVSRPIQLRSLCNTFFE